MSSPHPYRLNRPARSWNRLLHLFLTLALGLAACAPADTGRTAQISELRNTVNARETAGLEWALANEGQVVKVGGGVRTGADSRVRVDTAEGGIVRIGANTEFELLSLPLDADNPVTRLRLDAGKLWVAVGEALGAASSVEIETPTGVSSVRGSLMSVTQDAAGRLRITCLEGACRLSNAAGATDAVAGQQTEITAAAQAPAPATPMDPTQVRDWLLNFPEAITATQAIVAQIQPLQLSAGGQSATPQTAVTAEGVVLAAWEDRTQRPTGDYVVRELSLLGEWSAPVTLTEGFDLIYGDLTFLPNAAGEMCVFWSGATESTDPGTIGFYRRCRTAAGWTPAELALQQGFVARDYSLQLAPDGTLQEVHIESAGDVFFGEVQLSEGLNNLPALAIDTAGNYHAAWVNLPAGDSGEPFNVQYRFSADGGRTWSPVTRLSTVENAPSALTLNLLADGRGRVHVVWHGTTPAFESRLFYRQWTADAGWGEPVSASGEQGGTFGSAAAGPDGTVRVVWWETAGLFYAAQNADGAWGPPLKLGGSAGGYTSIAVDAVGASQVVWESAREVLYVVAP